MSTAAGAGRLWRLQVRTAGFALLTGVLVIAGSVIAVMTSVRELYGTPEARAEYDATLGRSPATAAFNGRPFDLDTLGGIAAYEVGFFGLLLLPALVMLLAIRCTRTQEDLGRTELMTSMQVGRMSPLLAGASTVSGVIAVSGVLVFAGLMVAGYSGEGSARYALALTLFLLGAAGLGLVCAELSQSGRSASILALSGLAIVYMIRAVIDGRSWDLGWVTPMGWFAEARPFSDSPPWWPMAALAGLAVAAFIVAFIVRGRRDLGAGVIAPRRGPAQGTLKSPTSLIIHVTIASAAAWMAGAALWGVAIGLLAEEMRTMLEGNPALAKALIGSSEASDDMMTYIAAILVGLMGATAGLQAVTRFAAEEGAGRIGVVMSTSVSRLGFWATAVLVIAIQVLLVLLVGGVAFGAGALATGADANSAWGGITTMTAFAAPAALVTAMGLALFAVSAKLTAVGWVVPLWALLVALLGETLQLPGWARDLSPIEWLGQLPIESLDWAIWWATIGAGALLVLAALPRLATRDISDG